MGAIEDLARAGSRPGSSAAAIMRGRIVDVRTDGLVSVTIPRYLSTEVIGPIPTAIPDLDPGDWVLVGTIGATTDRMVISLADGSQNWLGQPDLTIAPTVGADMDLFKPKGVAFVSEATATGGQNFPVNLGGLAEAWSRATGEKVQRYTDSDGRVHIRTKATGVTPWSEWSSSIISAGDISDASPIGLDVLTASDALTARTAMGLGNVSNTSDSAKPISTATLEELAKKANAHNPGFTGDVTGISKVHVGLDRVDNTPDVDKPVSLPVAARFALTDENWASAVSGLSSTVSGKEPTIPAGTTAQYWRGDKSWQTLDKTAVGLSNVDNTTDLLKPISTATQTAINGKANTVHGHFGTDITAGTVPVARLPLVTTSTDGLMLATDKVKLDNAVSTNTVSRLMIRDANGRAQVNSPSALADIANKSYVDGLVSARFVEYNSASVTQNAGAGTNLGAFSLVQATGNTFASIGGAGGQIVIDEDGAYAIAYTTSPGSGTFGASHTWAIISGVETIISVPTGGSYGSAIVTTCCVVWITASKTIQFGWTCDTTQGITGRVKISKLV
jgi:hypothetical protein